MSEHTIRLQSNQNSKTTLLGTVAPRRFGQLTDVNMIGVANGDLVSYDAATQTFVPVSNVSGVTTYATASGVSTSVIGGIGSITHLYVSGISTLGIVKISSGIVTATSGIVTYYGDGSKLTGVNAFNVVTQTITNNPVYPTFATATGVSSIGISTEQFVFIPSSGNLGIGTTNPQYKFHISGAGTTALFVDGNARITGILSIGTNTITLDPANNSISIGTAITLNATTGTIEVQGSTIVNTTGDAHYTGIVTAAYFYGDGSNLTGIIATNGLVLTDVSEDGLTFYSGKAAVGIATTEPFWSIRRTLFSSSGLVTSTGIARDIAWINRNIGIYT